MWVKANLTNVSLGVLGVLQGNFEPIPLKVYVPHSPNNCLLLIMTKLGQRVVQDSHIHGHVILMPWVFLLSRWVFGLARLHNHIMLHLQMLHQVVLGSVGHIAPMNLTNKLSIIPCPMYTL
jgi:hypothetical protein